MPILLLLIFLLLALLGGVAYAFVLNPKVPDLVGASSVEEAQEIADARFEVVEGDRVESEELIGTILVQDLEAGTRAPKGSTISVTVSDGINVRGETVSEAAEIEQTRRVSIS